eukprot:TRINITY_DN11838_c0_g1_i5.p1 TRINITY_DN11838_c0_g1~~TRINITY_DN11838_c0_g1_i5.p1  ORF type:complete len:315 (+),score=49.86 TRINITY_DN11838_c0_g1_i5:54-947(+)
MPVNYARGAELPRVYQQKSTTRIGAAALASLVQHNKAGRYADALREFDGLPRVMRSRFSCTAAGGAAANSTQWRRGLAIVAEGFRIHKHTRDLALWHLGTRCMTKGVQWQAALRWHSSMEHAPGPSPTDLSYSTAVGAARQGVAWAAVLSVTRRMTLARLHGEHTFCGGAAAMADAGRWQDALGLVTSLRRNRMISRWELRSINELQITVGALSSGRWWRRALRSFSLACSRHPVLRHPRGPADFDDIKRLRGGRHSGSSRRRVGTASTGRSSSRAPRSTSPGPLASGRCASGCCIG